MRDWKRESALRASYDASPKQLKRRAARARARYALQKGGTALTGKDVHHKDGNPNNNSRSNLSVTSKKKNRGWRKGQSGYKNNG